MFNFNKKRIETNISIATKNDLKDFHHLFNDFQQHHFKAKSDFFVNPKSIYMDSKSYWQTINEPNRSVFLARKNDLAVGMILVTIMQVPVGDLQYPRSRPTIEMLVVKEKYRREGIANLLLEYATNWAKDKGYSEIVTDVWFFSDSAREFFLKNDFNIRTQRYYKNIE